MISLKSIYDAFMVQGFKEVLLPFAMYQMERPSRYVQVPETRGGEEQEQEQQETSGGHAKDGRRREATKTGFSQREPRYVQVP